jgi:hypothetical protein
VPTSDDAMAASPPRRFAVARRRAILAIAGIEYGL